MTNQQLYFAIGLPCLTIVASLILNFISISGIHGRIDGIQVQLNSLRDDIREMRSDMKLLTGKVYELMGEKH